MEYSMSDQTKPERAVDPVIEAYKKGIDVTLIRENLRLHGGPTLSATYENAGVRGRASTRRKKGTLTKVTDFKALLRFGCGVYRKTNPFRNGSSGSK